MRSTLNIKHTNPADLARQLRSAAAKLDAGAVTPGADFKVGNVRIQVAQPQENDVRAWARANGYVIGGRGRVSVEIQTAYDEAQRVAAEKAEARAAKRAAAAASKKPAAARKRAPRKTAVQTPEVVSA